MATLPASAIPLPVPVVERSSARSRLVEAARLFTPQRLTVLALLAGAAVLYLWDLGASGWANSFYSAAVQAGASSWKAFLFGSFDASNFITVDKPPASLWVMELVARVFGVNAWSILVPQALEGVAAVGLLYATVRRDFGHAAGLVAGAVFALTPVAALMFRFNNPDALLVLLLVASAYALTRALERGRFRWLLLAGVLVGLGFLTKMLQAFVVLPVFAGVYLLAAPVTLLRRLAHLAGAGLAVLLSAGWWVALVALWPAADRPYIGGSSDNSILNLIFGYNGFGRITGSETGSVGGPSGWGPTGLFRMFNDSFGGQASWLIPAALVVSVAVIWLRGRAPRRDGRRAAALLWGGWLVLTGLLFSFAQGIIHPYYTVALAPAIGALVGMGGVELWRERRRLAVRGVAAAALVATSVWAYALLGRSPDWLPWLRTSIVVAGSLGAVGWLALPRVMASLAAGSQRAAAILLGGLAAASLLAALAGPVAYTLDTVATPHSGAIPSAGPVVASATGPGGAGAGGIPGGAFPGGTLALPAGASGLPAGGNGIPAGGNAGGGAAIGAGPGGAAGPRLGGSGGGSASGPGTGGAFQPPGAPSSRSGAGAPGGAGGGLLNAGTPAAAVVSTLEKQASRYQWVAATVGANNAAGYQLATGDPVMAIGGFNGTDPWPTLSAFEKLVSEGKVHYFIPGGGVGGSSASRAIIAWVEAHFSSTTVDGTTVYDLTAPSNGT